MLRENEVIYHSKVTLYIVLVSFVVTVLTYNLYA